ncbi:tripartite tricarboxylate transporter TctB family protein [Piscinibacter sakaiensis]|uniref:tripartite tricarboxylate transporter TctB family protein n=1 Tax=Piscinibacter sakaiensis TaxID=1547922 RepID=UPI003AB0C9CD
MQRTDRWLGVALIVLAAAVLWSARSFPKVPGQDLGAAFLPMLIGAGLLACGVVLLVRSLRGLAYSDEPARKPPGTEHFGSFFVIVAAVVFYIALADWLGFLIVAPLCLLAVFKAMRVSTGQAVLWAIGGTLLVHVGFYKLLRVPLPWGLLRPFY